LTAADAVCCADYTDIRNVSLLKLVFFAQYEGYRLAYMDEQ